MARKGLIREINVFIRNLIALRFHSNHSMARRLTAHHEAGHAVAAVAMGIGFECVSVLNDRDALGRIVLDQRSPHLQPEFNPCDLGDRQKAEGWILLALAGEFADAYHSGRKAGRSASARWDFRIAEALAERLFVHPGAREAFLNEMLCRAHRFVSDPLRWRQISAVAARLEQLHELDGLEVGRIMREIRTAEESGESEDRKQRRS